MDILKREIIAHTPFCSLVAKTLHGQDGGPPYYSLQLADYVSVVAPTPSGGLLLVRQYRPAVEGYTLELPAGCLEPGEDPAACARRELFEETGYEAASVEPLGSMIPDSGRLGNKVHCFFAAGAAPSVSPSPAEAGVQVVHCPLSDLGQWIRDGRIDHALHVAALFLAVLDGKLKF